MKIVVRRANLDDTRDAEAILLALDAYAQDPVGGGKPLADEVRHGLIELLRNTSQTLALLAFADDATAGVAICFYGVSTFYARPLLNIHDLAVLPQFRRNGIGSRLLASAEEHARAAGCCRLTLEVQEDNGPASNLYKQFGFDDFVIGDSAPTRFLQKPLAQAK